MTASRLFLSLVLAGCGSYRTNFLPMATKIPPCEAPRERNVAERKALFRRTVFLAANGAGNFRIAKLPANRQACQAQRLWFNTRRSSSAALRAPTFFMML